jgi:YebC/PmpR family DNA-binding regulatory protein
MAGHSKWANIKNRKGKQDAVRGRIFTKLGKAIAVAAKEGSDLNSNSRLRDAVAKAKAANMPSDTIERAIKKGAGELQGVVYEEIVYEGYGPGGIAVIVEALTDNRNRTASDVRHHFDKHGGNLGTTGCVGWMFDKKGVILIEKSTKVDEDELMMTALDAGAEDFSPEEEGYEITCEPSNFSSLRETLENAGYNFLSAEVTYVAQNTQALSDPEDIKKAFKMIDMLEDNDDVQNVYHNWDMPEEDGE